MKNKANVDILNLTSLNGHLRRKLEKTVVGRSQKLLEESTVGVKEITELVFYFIFDFIKVVSLTS